MSLLLPDATGPIASGRSDYPLSLTFWLRADQGFLSVAPIPAACVCTTTASASPFAAMALTGLSLSGSTVP
jgi:hypothetical protein